jgi:hypothetical protein
VHHALGYWRQAQEGPRQLTEQKKRSFLHASRTWEGMVRVDGELDPESGEMVLAALEAVMAVPGGEVDGEHHPAPGSGAPKRSPTSAVATSTGETPR